MIQIIKKKNYNDYYYYIIKTNEGRFMISFEGNLDLYWTYIYEGNLLKEPESHDFKITKENYFLYNLNDNPFNKENNEDEYDIFNQNKLFENETIKWHSDDSIYELSSKLEIKKEKDHYKITFYKSKEEFMIYSVRISNSGSRYGYFNIPFMNMYNKLKEYNPYYHQIHIEEYVFDKKVKKLK